MRLKTILLSIGVLVLVSATAMAFYANYKIGNDIRDFYFPCHKDNSCVPAPAIEPKYLPDGCIGPDCKTAPANERESFMNLNQTEEKKK